MGSPRVHIGIIVFFAILLHLPVFTGILKPVPPNFTWASPWSSEASSEKGGYYDYQQEYLPWAFFLKESLKSGEFPLWNPHQFCGTPYAANHLLSPVYPLVLVATIAPFEMLAYVLSLINFILGPIFLYAYLKRIGVAGVPSLFGALIFTSMGIFTPYFPPWGAAIVWVPAILYILEGWMQGNGGWRQVPLMGIVLGLWFIGGYPIFVVHGLYFILLYAILLSSLRMKAGVILKLLVALLLGILISAAQNLPTFFFALDSARFIPGRDDLLEPMFSMGNILNHLIPAQTGAYKTSYLYLGLIAILPLPFAFVRPTVRAIYHLAWFVLSLAIGLIPTLFISLHNTLPMWDITPHPPIVPLFITLPILAAMGLNMLYSQDVIHARGKMIALVIAVSIFALTTVFAFISGVNKTIILYLLCAAIATIIIVRFMRRPLTDRIRFQSSIVLLLVILLTSAGIFWSNIRHNRSLDELTDESIFHGHLKAIQEDDGRFFRMGGSELLPPNMGILWGLDDAGGYDSLILRNYYEAMRNQGVDFFRARESMPLVLKEQFSQTFYEEFGISTMLLTPGVSGPVGSGWRPVATPGAPFRLYQNKTIWHAGFIPEGKFMVDSIRLDYTVTGPNSIDVDIGGDHGSGSVVVRDTFAPGWKASLDGEEIEIEIYHNWMRKVDVPPKAEKLSMTYDPVEFKIGSALSILGLFISLSWMLGGYRRKN